AGCPHSTVWSIRSTLAMWWSCRRVSGTTSSTAARCHCASSRCTVRLITDPEPCMPRRPTPTATRETCRHPPVRQPCAYPLRRHRDRFDFDEDARHEEAGYLNEATRRRVINVDELVPGLPDGTDLVDVADEVGQLDHVAKRRTRLGQHGIEIAE